jgi:RNA polymerase sigma-70 factor (ECF subfamily)
VSTKIRKESSLLGPVIGAYEPPTQADADRIFAKIEAALDAAPPASSTRLSATSRTSLITRLSCVALAIGAAIAYRAATNTSSPPAVAPQAERGSVTTQVTASRSPDVRGMTSETPSIPSVAVDSLPSLSAAAPAKTPSSTKPDRPAASTPSLRAAAPNNDTLEKEARMLAAARRASDDGAGDRALALLDEHTSMFPNGWLANERDAERILVLCRLGRRAEATRAAAVFLDGRPKSPLTHRVEMSCAGSPDTK